MSPASSHPPAAVPHLPTRGRSCADTGGRSRSRTPPRSASSGCWRSRASGCAAGCGALPIDFRLDADELCQELMLSMLRRSTTVDEGNSGVRTWLGSRVDWTAQDMLRRRGREETVGRRGSRGHRARHGHPPAGAGSAGPDDARRRNTWSSWASRPHEAQVVALRCTGVDMPLKDFAELVHRSYASVRKEYERGTRKIEELFGLTAEEVLVVRAWRKHGTAAAAAPHVNRSSDEVIQIVEGAHKKIDRIFRDGGSSVMSAELPDHEFGAARAPGKTDARPVTHLAPRARGRVHPPAGDAARLARAPRRAAAPHRRGRRADRRDPPAGAGRPTGWSTTCCASSSTAPTARRSRPRCA